MYLAINDHRNPKCRAMRRTIVAAIWVIDSDLMGHFLIGIFLNEVFFRQEDVFVEKRMNQIMRKRVMLLLMVVMSKKRMLLLVVDDFHHEYGDVESIRRILKIFFRSLAKCKHEAFRQCVYVYVDYDVLSERRIWGILGNHKVEEVLLLLVSLPIHFDS